jgi:hypothetical protein
VPKVFRTGTVIYRPDDLAVGLFVLVSGEVHLATAVTGTDEQSGSPRGARPRLLSMMDVPTTRPTVAVRTLKAVEVFGGMSWIQNLTRQHTASAQTTSDVFYISREAIKAELAACAHATVPQLFPGDDDVSSLRYLPYARAIPLLATAVEEALMALEAAEALPRQESMVTLGSFRRPKKTNGSLSPMEAAKEIAAAFALRIHEPGTTLCATAAQVDRLIIPLSGKAKVTGGADSSTSLVIGECIGFPLLVPHRWSQRVIVTAQLEALELPFDTYHDILKKYGLAKKVSALSHALLFPDAAKPHVRQLAADAVCLLRGPRLHPVTSVQTIATGQAPLDALASNNSQDVLIATSGASASLSRKPTETQLRKLKPIPVRVGMACTVFSSMSKTRIMARTETPPARDHQLGGVAGNSPSKHGVLPSTNTPPPRLQPLVLGKHKAVLFNYGEKLPGAPGGRRPRAMQ